MQATWWTRLSIVVIVLIWGVWSLVPSFLGDSTQDMLASQASDAGSFAQQADVQVIPEDPEADFTPLGDVGERDVQASGDFESFDFQAYMKGAADVVAPVNEIESAADGTSTDLGEVGASDVLVNGMLSSFDEKGNIETASDGREGYVTRIDVGGDTRRFTVAASGAGRLDVRIGWSDWLGNDAVSWEPAPEHYEVVNGIRRVKSDRLQALDVGYLEPAEGQEEGRRLLDRMVIGVVVSDSVSGMELLNDDTVRTFGDFRVSIPVPESRQVEISLTGQFLDGQSPADDDGQFTLEVGLIEEALDTVYTVDASAGGDVDAYEVIAEQDGELEIALKWRDWLDFDGVTSWAPREQDFATGADGVRRVIEERVQRVDADRRLTDRMVSTLLVTDSTGATLWEGDTRSTFGNFSVKVPVAAGEPVNIQLTGTELYGKSIEDWDRNYQLLVRLIEAEPDIPWWATLLPNSRINLGLDLQGGIDITLGVDIEEAVRSEVQRDVKPLIQQASDNALALTDVKRKPGTAELHILVGDGVTTGAVDDLMKDNYPNYERTGESEGFLVFELTETRQEEIKVSAMEQALETLRSRIDETGVKEPAITQKGGSQINVQLPGMENVEDAMSAIGTAAVLEFMPVHEDVMGKQATLQKALLNIEKQHPDRYLDDEWISNKLKEDGSIPKDARLLWEYGEGQASNTRQSPYVLFDEVILTGDDVNDAHVSWNQFNEPYVALEFDAKGGRVFAEYTGQHVGDRFAIVLDGKVRSAPVIREKIGGGRASIEMGSGDNLIARDDASRLALVLRTGSLPAPVKIDSVRTVGATLGADAIQAGKTATVVGFSLVLVFMLLYYKKAGAVSVIALVCNLMLVMALLATVGATLTLPGIAGIALTVGMAVDCNIIIFERIREEKALGKTARAATDAGFSKAFLAVIDANITTFIAGVVLYTYGTGPIKGFAVTLMIGILTTLFTGIFLSRTIMDWMTRKTSARLSI